MFLSFLKIKMATAHNAAKSITLGSFAFVFRLRKSRSFGKFQENINMLSFATFKSSRTNVIASFYTISVGISSKLHHIRFEEKNIPNIIKNTKMSF